MCCSRSAGSSTPISASSTRSPATPPSSIRPPTSSIRTCIERSRPSAMSAWLPPRARSRRWSVSYWSFSRIGWCAAPSRQVQSSSPVVVIPTRPPRQRAGYRRVRPGQIAIHASLLLLSFLFLFPLVLLVSASLSSETDISRYGFTLVPRRATFDAYQYVLQEPSQILTAHAATITATAICTPARVPLMALLAYPISPPHVSLPRP